MTDCTICCEKLLKSVICNFCDFQSCSTCTRRYIVESESKPKKKRETKTDPEMGN